MNTTTSSVTCPSCKKPRYPHQMRPCPCMQGRKGFCIFDQTPVCPDCLSAHRKISEVIARHNSAPSQSPVQQRANSRQLTTRHILLGALQAVEAETPGCARVAIEMLKNSASPEEAIRHLGTRQGAETQRAAGQILVALAEKLRVEEQVQQIFRALAAEADRNAARQREARRFLRDVGRKTR